MGVAAIGPHSLPDIAPRAPFAKIVRNHPYLGPIHTIPDSSCTTFFTESDIKISHIHTISDSVLGVIHTTPLRFIHDTKPFVYGLKIKLRMNTKLTAAQRELPERRCISFHFIFKYLDMLAPQI